MKLYVVCLLVTLTAVSCGPAPDDVAPVVEHLNSPEMAAQNFPFSEAVRVGNTLYLSGQIGLVPGTRSLAEGGLEGEARQTLENIRATLTSFGSGMDDVVKCTVFLADIDDWPAFNAVYTQYFREPFPARSAVAGSGLALGARVEVECIAVVKQ